MALAHEVRSSPLQQQWWLALIPCPQCCISQTTGPLPFVCRSIVDASCIPMHKTTPERYQANTKTISKKPPERYRPEEDQLFPQLALTPLPLTALGSDGLYAYYYCCMATRTRECTDCLRAYKTLPITTPNVWKSESAESANRTRACCAGKCTIEGSHGQSSCKRSTSMRPR